MSENTKAIVLLSGGLDSTTSLAVAQSEGYLCYTLSFQYGQRHQAELNAATKIAKQFNVVEHKLFNIDLWAFKGSALTDKSIDVPTSGSTGIPVTYVPARNTVFLSIALAWAEVLEVQHLFIGVNAVDYSGYPDCRPEFIKAFQDMANLSTKASIDGKPLKIHTPLISLKKEEIIKLGKKLGVDYSITISCYAASKNGEACGECDSCRFRKQGFQNAGISDPTLYI